MQGGQVATGSRGFGGQHVRPERTPSRSQAERMLEVEAGQWGFQAQSPGQTLGTCRG